MCYTVSRSLLVIDFIHSGVFKDFLPECSGLPSWRRSSGGAVALGVMLL